MDVQPLAFIGTILAIIGILIEHFHYQAKLQERVAILETKQNSMEGMEGDVREIKTKINLFWGALEDQIPHLLMRGNPIEPGSKIYELLDKLAARNITCEEMHELSQELKIEVRNDHTPGEKLAMVFADALLQAKIMECEKDGTVDCSV